MSAAKVPYLYNKSTTKKSKDVSVIGSGGTGGSMCIYIFTYVEACIDCGSVEFEHALLSVGFLCTDGKAIGRLPYTHSSPCFPLCKWRGGPSWAAVVQYVY